MLQNLVVEYEKLADPRLPACSRKSGYLLETCCSIMDCKGISLMSAKSVYSYLQRASAISQNYYPERLGKLYIINAPWGFSSVFAVIKRFLDPVTVAKIQVLGSNYESELLTQVPKENLPKSLGGDCDCEGGCMFSDLGPWKDPQYAKPAAWEKENAEESGEASKDEIKATDTSEGVEETGQPATGSGTEVEADKQPGTEKAPVAA
jgi:CRAL/TRIO domain